MAEFVIGPLFSMVKDKASSYLLDQYKVMEGMEDQRKILERKLPAILDVIEDAEEKGAYRPGVRAWLDALKMVAYEANDVFDEFKYKALRRDAKEKGHYRKLGFDVVSLFPSHNPIFFRYRMGKKLCRIVQTIEVLVTEMNAFGFKHLQQAPPSKQWRQTDSIMPDSEKDIVSRSRDDEKTTIVKILLDQASNSDLMVLPIVGMGGLGKTTFARLIYNDPEIKKHFELRKWCCVSDDFDVGNIASSICQTSEKDRETALQNLLKEVSGKRYLIVLDDVWNEDADKWEKLKTCLKQGGKGSAILTTTRKAQVAQIMKLGIDEDHNLGKLDKIFLKEILKNRAFSLQKLNSDELDGIVDKIVGRCAGSPLAAKAFGSVLSTKSSMQEWEDVLTKSNICNEKTEILPILKLGYDDLPSHMKQCFAFCAIFPKDYEIDVGTLIQLWMAHDFIPMQEEDHLENKGKEFFKELAWRSFFQDVEQSPAEWDRQQLRCRMICKIHDLMHDIALSVMGRECITIVDCPNKNKLLSGPIHHVFSSYDRIGTLLDDFLKKQSPTLQTLLYPNAYTGGSAPHLANHSSLRVLQLFRLKELPLRPRHLQHLRYLDLSNNSYIRELPEEMSILYNLQTLKLYGCQYLVRLPKDMKYMTSLRHLYTNGCSSLKCMPPDLGQLTSLQTLTYFVVGASPGCSTVRELRNINLGGELELCGLENVAEEDAKAASLRNKEKLTHLSLKWSGDSHEEPVPNCHKQMLDALKPHGGLLMLRIVSYKSNILPTWMTDLSLLQHLTELHLVHCSICEKFPLFCHLRGLEVLHLKGLDKLQFLCSDAASAAFPALKELKLNGLNSLERWVATDVELTFPLLEKLKIKSCSKLTTLAKAPKLKVVELKEDEAHLSLSIVKSRRMSTLYKLELDVSDRKAIPTLQLDDCEVSLSEMKLSGCDVLFHSSPSQSTIGIWKRFGQLVNLRIESCDALIYWPEEEFLCLVLLKNLTIRGCSNLMGPTKVKGDPARAKGQLLPRLKTLQIGDCGRLTELFLLPPSLTTISIHGCTSLEFILRKEDTKSESVQVEQVDTFISSTHYNDIASASMPEQSTSPKNDSLPPCLEHLVLISCDKLVALPNLPPSLTSLGLHSCDKLLALPDLPPSLTVLIIQFSDKLCSLSGQLDALKRLDIWNCNMLESLDCLGDMPSLESLFLYRCKRLASLPRGCGSYSPYRRLTIRYCPTINMKPLYERRQWLDSIERKDLSHAHSSNPREGPKLRDPKSWKYAMPGCGYWGCQEEED